MTTTHPDPLSHLLERLSGLAPRVAADSDAIERDRCLPRPLFAALAETGLFRLWLPRAFGGLDLSPVAFLQVIEAAAALDSSIAWLAGNGAASRFAGYLPPDAARHFFADPHAYLVAATGAVGRAVAVPGGYRVSGRWPFGSGIHNASAVAGLCAIEAPDAAGAPSMLICCAPISAATVIDTWQVSGLRGTGSCDFVLEDVFVPADHSFGFPDHRPTQPGIVYRLPIVSSFAWSIAGVPLGLARVLLDNFVAMARTTQRQGTSLPLRERETTQAAVGRADAMIKAARALLIAAMQALTEAVERNDQDLLGVRAGLRQAAAHAAETALHVAAMLEPMAGTAAIFEAGPLARRLRDLRAAVQHVAMSPNNFIVCGRLQLGLEPGSNRV